MKNPGREIESEMKNWFEDRGYFSVVTVLNGVAIGLLEEMSEEDIIRFSEDFEGDLEYKGILEGAGGYKRGAKKRNVVSEGPEIHHYSFSHPLVEKYKCCLEEWFDNQGFDCDYWLFSGYISIYSHDTLADDQIASFEKEFEVKYDENWENCPEINHYFFDVKDEVLKNQRIL